MPARRPAVSNFRPQGCGGHFVCQPILGREATPGCVSARGHRKTEPRQTSASLAGTTLTWKGTPLMPSSCDGSVGPTPPASPNWPEGRSTPPAETCPKQEESGRTRTHNTRQSDHLCRFGFWGRGASFKLAWKTQNNHVERNSTPDILWMSRGKRYIWYFTPPGQ